MTKYYYMSFLLVFLASALNSIAFAQNVDSNKAKAYYFQAQKAFSAADYDTALSAIEKTESLLGSENPSTLAMKIKISFAQSKYETANLQLDRFYSLEAGDALVQEMSGYLIQIDDKLEEQKVARAKAIQAAQDAEERKRIAALEAEAAKKAKVIADDQAKLKLLIEQCDEKNSSACFSLGYRYHAGKSPSTEVNYPMAASYYARSCFPEENHTAACNNLGQLYQQKKIGTDMRFVGGVYSKQLKNVRSEYGMHEAFVLYKLACDQSSDEYSCNNLGNRYQFGVYDGGDKVIIPSSTKLARTAFKKACDAGRESACKQTKDLEADDLELLSQQEEKCINGDIPSCRFAGHSFASGKRVIGSRPSEDSTKSSVIMRMANTKGQPIPIDLTKAIKYFTMGCDGENYPSCLQLGMISVKANTTNTNLTLGYQSLNKACQKGGIEFACNELQTLQTDIKKIVDPLVESCHGGSGQACEELGDAYDLGSRLPEDNPRARQYFLKGCDLGKARSCNIFGVMNLSGEGGPVSQTTAIEYMKKACMGKYFTGCLNLGENYRDGTGVEKDLAKAASYFRQTCQHRERSACDKLRELFRIQNIQVDIESLSLLMAACEDKPYSKHCDFIERNVSDVIKNNFAATRATNFKKIVKTLNRMAKYKLKVTDDTDTGEVFIVSSNGKVVASSSSDCEIVVTGKQTDEFRYKDNEPFEETLDLDFEWGDDADYGFELLDASSESAISTRTPYCFSGMFCSKSKQSAQQVLKDILKYRQTFCASF